MFKNLTIYRIASSWAPDFTAFLQALEKMPFIECSLTQERSTGWVPARGEKHGAMAESIGGQWIAKFFTEAKAIPGKVLARKVEEKAAHIEATEGRKPGKKEKKELKDEAKLELLPQTFAKQQAMFVWIDPEKRILALDTATQARADEVVGVLVEALQGFALALLDTQTSPQAAMAHWLVEQEAPTDFTVDRECELKAADESKAVVKYGRHPLDIEEVQEHILRGKLPTRLAMTWDDRVSFVLTEGLQLRKLSLLDAVMDGDDKEGGFDADVAIFTGEARKMIQDLIDALGGEGRTGN